MGTIEITTEGHMLLLRGAFDVRSTGTVRAAIDAHLKEWTDEVVLDLQDVTSVDPTALKVVAAATRRATADGAHLVVRGAGGQVLRMLHLTHLIRVVELEREPVAI